MKKYLKEVNVANDIRLQLGVFKGAIVLVEGATDRAFFANFLNGKRSRFKVGEGKRRVVKILHLLQGATRVLGIVDADYWPITGERPALGNLFVTDTTDVESLIIKSDAFRKTLNNYCDAETLEKFVESCGLSDSVAIRDLLVEGAAKIGFLRLSNEREKKSMDFKALCFEQFVKEDTFKLDEAALCEEFAAQNADFPQLVRKWILEADKEIDDPWRFACGHDIVAMLVVGLRRSPLGYKTHYSEAEIEAGLRQAFERAHFEKTDLCQSIESWASQATGGSLLHN